MPVGISTEYDANSIKRKPPTTQADIRAHLLRVKREAESLQEKSPRAF